MKVTARLEVRSAAVGQGEIVSFLFSPGLEGAKDAVHVKPIERLRLLMFILEISHWLIDVVRLHQGPGLLSPGTQVNLGDGRRVTRQNVVTEI